MRFAGAGLLILLVSGGTGCCALFGNFPKPPNQKYTGPTDPMAQVIQDVNQNNNRIQTLYTRLDFEAQINDPQTKQSHFLNGDGVLQIRKPRELRLIGNKDIAGRIFDIGSNSEKYWLEAYQPEPARMWWGYHRNAGKPCAAGVPLRPDLFMQVLGVGDIDTNLLQLPVPTMRYNGDMDYYMITWSAPAGDHWYIQKEIWYRRDNKLPAKVILYDPNGRVVVRADLSKHEAMNQGQGPVLARHYSLFFPDTLSTMVIDIREAEPQIERNGIVFPNDNVFRFPSELPDNVRQVDQDCDNHEPN